MADAKMAADAAEPVVVQRAETANDITYTVTAATYSCEMKVEKTVDGSVRYIMTVVMTDPLTICEVADWQAFCAKIEDDDRITIEPV